MPLQGEDPFNNFKLFRASASTRLSKLANLFRLWRRFIFPPAPSPSRLPASKNDVSQITEVAGVPHVSRYSGASQRWSSCSHICSQVRWPRTVRYKLDYRVFIEKRRPPSAHWSRQGENPISRSGCSNHASRSMQLFQHELSEGRVLLHHV